MTAAIALITLGGLMVYSAIHGISVVDALKGVVGDTPDPKGGFQGGFGGGDFGGDSSQPTTSGDLPHGASPTGHTFAGPNADLLAQLERVAVNQFHLTITSEARTTEPIGHADYHNANRAFDASGAASDMAAYARYAAKTYGRQLLELFYAPAGITIKNGHNVFPLVFDKPNHVHTAA